MECLYSRWIVILEFKESLAEINEVFQLCVNCYAGVTLLDIKLLMGPAFPACTTFMSN